MPLPEPGETILGKYQITSRLGAGGMGTVFAAQHLKLGELVALKFLQPDLASRPDIASRFLQEAVAGRRITSTHVAKVDDIDSFGDVPFIVMEHLEGETLAACLARRGALPVDEAVDLLLQACEAVHEAHTLRIVHRDLKPANLFLTKDSGGATSLKVLDFGISKFENLAVTSSESLLGTPLYMSPEQVDDSAQVDARSDVWSLGVVLFEMLSGKQPFEGSSRSALYVAIKSGRRAKVTALRADIPPRLEAAIEHALAIAPDARVASVEAFAASIVQFGTKAGGASLDRMQRVADRASARPPGVPEPVAPLAPVHTAAGPDATSVVESVAETPPPVLVTTPPRKPRSRLVVALSAMAVAASVGVVGVRSHWFSKGAESAASGDAACAEGATPACEAACATKAPGACHALARALLDGKGAPADAPRAATLFQAECDDGGMAGCNMLGNLYEQGKGVPLDRNKAVTLFQKACTGDFGAGCVNLGNAFAEGKVVMTDESRALGFYAQACDAGEALGCYNASVFYAEGRGVVADLARAYRFADRACTKGAPLGCVRVARAEIQGEGIAKDTSAGLGQLNTMCANRAVEGCKALVKVYERGLGDVKSDPNTCAEYRTKACDLGDAESCKARSLVKTVDLTSTMPSRINASMRDACNAGKMVSCEMFGRNLIDGRGMPKDLDAGAAYLAKACRGGQTSACEAGGR